MFCTENHDQVGNRAFGERLAHLIDRERYLVASAVLLLAPETPLIFQGQEFAATSPFLYFTDHTPQLGRLVTAGRREEFKAFSAFRDPSVRAQIPDPQADATFLRSRLNFSDRERHADVYRVYQELLTLRRTDPVLRHQDRQATRAWTVGEHLLVLLRWHASEHRLLLANFGDAPARVSVQELQLPSTQDWRSVWSTPASAPLVDALELDAQHVQPRAAHLLALHT